MQRSDDSLSSSAWQGDTRADRAVLFYRAADKAVFLYLFAKNQKANLTNSELDIYRKLAEVIGKMSQADIAAALKTERWIVIEHENEQVSD